MTKFGIFPGFKAPKTIFDTKFQWFETSIDTQHLVLTYTECEVKKMTGNVRTLFS